MVGLTTRHAQQETEILDEYVETNGEWKMNMKGIGGCDLDSTSSAPPTTVARLLMVWSGRSFRALVWG